MMWRVTLKGLLAHKFRLLMTSFAIVLGVSFIAGTLVLTDTIGNVFDTLMTDSTRGVDVAVRTRQTFAPGAENGGSWARDPVPANLTNVVATVPGVKGVDGWVGGYAQFIGKDGKAIKNTEAPTLGMSVGTVPEITNGLHVVDGRNALRAGEVVMDQATARRHDFRVGERVRMLFQGPPETYTLVGIVKFGDAGNLAGATIAGFDTKTAQRVLNRVGKYDTLQVVAQPGVSQTVLRDRVTQALRAADPATRYEAVTGKQLAAERVSDFRSMMSFFDTFMLVFALIALFVGAFIIYNTFSIVVAQRAREIGLLRAIGASRAQVTRSVTVEAIVVGIASSLVGVAAGVFVAFGLEAMMKGVGIEMPGGATSVATRTIVVSLLAGTLVTFLAATAPARRAARIPPIEALHADASVRGSGWRRYAVGGAFFTIGAVGTGIGLFGTVPSGVPGGAAACVGVSAMLVFLGIAMLSPVLAHPLTEALGWYPAHVRGEAGLLARENALRNGRRTASTASALMIGLALMTFVTIFGASAKASVSKAVDESVRADWIIKPSGQGTVSPVLAQRLLATKQFSAVVGFRTGVWQDTDGHVRSLIGTDTDRVQQVLDLKVREGSITSLNRGGVLVYKDAAKANHWRVGDVLRMRFDKTGYVNETVRGIFDENRAISSNYVISLPEYQRNYNDQLDVIVGVRDAPGVSALQAKATVDRVLRDYPSVEAQDQAGYKADLQAQFDTLLNLMQALLILSVIIAVLGIANTLALSIFERTRELGLLRAVGMTRRQVRTMIRWESVIVAAFGALLGLAIGIASGRVVVAALADKGVALAVPVVQIVSLGIVGAVAGLLASVLPARRATHVDVLTAVHTE